MATYDSENQKVLRSPAKVGIRLYVGTTKILEFDNSNLISVNLTLRGVETKVEDPTLQASDIEIQAYYTGSINDLLQFRGKNTRILYKSSYASTVWQNDVASQHVGVRVFYTNLNTDNVKLKDNILTIKGTDFTGTLVKQIWNLAYLDPSWTRVTYNGTSYYRLRDMWKSFLEWCLPTDKMPTIDANPYPGEFYLKSDRVAYVYRWIAPDMSWRKRIAQIMNVFRGSTSDIIAPRGVYVDAGCPHFKWFNLPVETRLPSAIETGVAAGNRIANIQSYDIANGKYNSVWYNGIWNIDYADVADFEIEYGNAISKIIIDTPYVNKIAKTMSVEMRSNMSDIITLEELGIIRRIEVTASGSGSTIPSTFSVTQLDSKTGVVKCGSFSGTCNATIYYDIWAAIYNNPDVTSIPDLIWDTGISGGDEVTLELLPFLRAINGKFVPSNTSYYGQPTDYNIYYHMRGINRAVQGCNIAQPRWITFKWRGHPGMQPRDIILFTEKDGTKNYYEVDYLTLEHKDGGLISEVKAMYKMPYSS